MNERTPGTENALPVVIERWFHFMATGESACLDNLLDTNAVFYSPAVYAPQEGRDKVISYLVAAERMFAGSNFRYVGSWYGDRSAVLEFEVDLDGVQIQGIDMLHWNSANRITSFKVMIRPLRGLQAVIPLMGEFLNK